MLTSVSDLPCNQKPTDRSEGNDLFRNDPFKVNSYNFRYPTSRQPVFSNVFPTVNCVEENTQIYPALNLGQCQPNWPMMFPRPFCRCGHQRAQANYFCCQPQIPATFPCAEERPCCCKASTQTLPCSEEKPCVFKVPSQQTVFTCVEESPCGSKTSECSDESPCSCKTQLPTIFEEKAKSPCGKCKNCQRPQRRESNPCITIRLRIKSGEDVKVVRISENELCISQCEKQETSDDDILAYCKKKCCKNLNPKPTCKKTPDQRKKGGACCRKQQSKEKVCCSKAFPTGTSEECRWCRLDYQKSASDTSISITSGSEKCCCAQPCKRKPKRIFIFKELKQKTL